MSTIAAIQTQADLLIKGSAPPNDHFLHPKALPTMPWEMKYEERRHASADPRIQKQIKDEEQFQNTIMEHIWSDVISKYSPTLEERWMTAIDLEKMLLSQGVTNARLRGKVCTVLDTTGVVFDGSTSVSLSSLSASSTSGGKHNNSNEPFRGILKKGMNVNGIMSSLFSTDNNDDDTMMMNTHNSNNHLHDDATTTVTTTTTTQMMGGGNQKAESNSIRMTNLRNEMRWNGIVVCKQMLLLLTDPTRQDDFIETCFDLFDRNDPAKRTISKNLLLHTDLKPISNEEEPPQTFRWFETIPPPESAKKYTKEQSQNPKIQKEMTKYLEAQRKKLEEESTFVLPDIPSSKKKKKKKKKGAAPDLPTKMMSGATYYQLEPLKEMIMVNEIGNEFYPHITYEDFKTAFLNPKNSKWVCSFLGVIFEAMATFCTVGGTYNYSNITTTASSSGTTTDNNNNITNSSIFSTTTSARKSFNTSTIANVLNDTRNSAMSNSSSVSAPLPPLPWITKTLHTVQSAPLMADSDVLLLLQLEKAGGSATDPVEKKKRRMKSSSSKNSSMMNNSSSSARNKNEQESSVKKPGGSSSSKLDDIFGTSGVAGDFLASMKRSSSANSSTNNNINSGLPTIGVSTPASSKQNDDDDDQKKNLDDGDAKKRTRVKFV